jgi:glyoxylase I family protein
MTAAVNGLHHVTIRVQDPDATRAFYEGVLGLGFMEIPVGPETFGQWRGRPDAGTLLATQVGSTFVIVAPPLEGTADDDRFSERRIGVDHLAFGVDGHDQLEELAGSLQEARVSTAGIETDPVLGKEYVCFRDPDNIQWEFYVST